MATQTKYMSDIKLGQTYRDEVTGFTGTATAIIFRYKSDDSTVVLSREKTNDAGDIESVVNVTIEQGRLVTTAPAAITGSSKGRMPKPAKV